MDIIAKVLFKELEGKHGVAHIVDESSKLIRVFSLMKVLIPIFHISLKNEQNRKILSSLDFWPK